MGRDDFLQQVRRSDAAKEGLKPCSVLRPIDLRTFNDNRARHPLVLGLVLPCVRRSKAPHRPTHRERFAPGDPRVAPQIDTRNPLVTRELKVGVPSKETAGCVCRHKRVHHRTRVRVNTHRAKPISIPRTKRRITPGLVLDLSGPRSVHLSVTKCDNAPRIRTRRQPPLHGRENHHPHQPQNDRADHTDQHAGQPDPRAEHTLNRTNFPRLRLHANHPYVDFTSAKNTQTGRCLFERVRDERSLTRSRPCCSHPPTDRPAYSPRTSRGTDSRTRTPGSSLACSHGGRSRRSGSAR